MEHHHSNVENSQAGLSIPEAVIGSVLVAALLGMIYGSVHSISTVAQTNNENLESQRTQADVVDMLRSELMCASRDDRIELSNGGNSIRYQCLEGASLSGSDISGAWSPWITVSFQPSTGTVTRLQNGQSVEVARGVQNLTFSMPASGDYVDIDCVTNRKGQLFSRTGRAYLGS